MRCVSLFEWCLCPASRAADVLVEGIEVGAKAQGSYHGLAKWLSLSLSTEVDLGRSNVSTDY